VTRNVKRWCDGKMVKRWIAASVLEAQRGFRRLRGYKGMPILIRAVLDYAEQIDCLDDQK
jgi:putative transposase